MSPTVTIGGEKCTEAEAAIIYQALALFAAIGTGQLQEVGITLANEYTIRRDLPAFYRQRLAKIRQLFDEAHRILHDGNEKAGFDPTKDAVSSAALRASLLVFRFEQNLPGIEKVLEQLRQQAFRANTR